MPGSKLSLSMLHNKLRERADNVEVVSRKRSTSPAEDVPNPKPSKSARSSPPDSLDSYQAGPSHTSRSQSRPASIANSSVPSLVSSSSSSFSSYHSNAFEVALAKQRLDPDEYGKHWASKQDVPRPSRETTTSREDLAAQPSARFHSVTTRRPAPPAPATQVPAMDPAYQAAAARQARMAQAQAVQLAHAEAQARAHAKALKKQSRLQDEMTPRHWEEDYTEDIISYSRELDRSHLPSAQFMDLQPELQWFMRPYLVDFLIEVHHQFRLRPETLYLAMNIVDRYTSRRVVYKKHYQLVGCAGLWIAAKFEDSKDKVPTVHELAEMCCRAYDESAFLQMEGHVLHTIQWMLSVPTPEWWLRHKGLRKGASEDIRVMNVARFIMETSLFHKYFVGITAEMMANTCLVMARYICSRSPGFRNLRFEDLHFDDAMVEEIRRIATLFDENFYNNISNVSEILVKKYVADHYSHASAIVREFYLQGGRFRYDAFPTTPRSMRLSQQDWEVSPTTMRMSGFSTSPSAGSLSCQSSEYGDGPNTPLTPATPATQVHHIYSGQAQVRGDQPAKENVPPPPRFSFSGPSTVESVKTQQATYLTYNPAVLREMTDNVQHPHASRRSLSD